MFGLLWIRYKKIANALLKNILMILRAGIKLGSNRLKSLRTELDSFHAVVLALSNGLVKGQCCKAPETVILATMIERLAIKVLLFLKCYHLMSNIGTRGKVASIFAGRQFYCFSSLNR